MPALLIIGILIIIGGLTLFVFWFEYLWALVKAFLPLGIIVVGGITAYFGWEAKKDRRGAYLDFSSPTEASRYQAEALAYQEKLSDFQDESLASDPVLSWGEPYHAPDESTSEEDNSEEDATEDNPGTEKDVSLEK
jgi:hypothetical protein